MKLIFINGPNLNLLGIREPELYGKKDYTALVTYIETICQKENIVCTVFQSNHEGAIVDKIQEAYGNYDGIILNAAAYTHTSIAIQDAIKAVAIPTVEVHLTNPKEREAFRHISFLEPVCVKTFAGFGFEGYKMAIEFFIKNKC